MLAYTPRKPAIHYLNPVAWVVAELCDGSSGSQIYAAFQELNKGRIGEPELQEAFESAMAQLLEGELVNSVPNPSPQEKGIEGKEVNS